MPVVVHDSGLRDGGRLAAVVREAGAVWSVRVVPVPSATVTLAMTMPALPIAPFLTGSAAPSFATDVRVSSSLYGGGNLYHCCCPPLSHERRWKPSWSLLPPPKPTSTMAAAKMPCFTVPVVGEAR